MTSEYNTADIYEYLDREAIRDLLYRYSHAIDRCDAELLRSVYWPEAIDDHGIWVGKRDEYVAWVIPTLEGMLSVSQHFMGNILIRIDGNTAIVETYFQAFHRCETAGKPAEDMVQGGRYIDRMEKRGKEWRIAHRLVSFDYFREYPDSGHWTEAKFMPAPRINGTRNPTDPTYDLFAGSLMRAPFVSASSR
jgi:hypothetical protein